MSTSSLIYSNSVVLLLLVYTNQVMIDLLTSRRGRHTKVVGIFSDVCTMQCKMIFQFLTLSLIYLHRPICTNFTNIFISLQESDKITSNKVQEKALDIILHLLMVA